jgi:DNA repair exonuclease SbcCD ATPase subunit
VIRLFLILAVISTFVLTAALSAEASPARAAEGDGILCQEKDEPEKPEPDPQKRKLTEKMRHKRMEGLRREIKQLHIDMEKAKKKRQQDKVGALLEMIRDRERDLHELEKLLQPGEPQEPEIDRKEWDEERQERMEELREEIQDLRKEAEIAKGRRHHEKAKNLMHEVKELERELHEIEKEKWPPRPKGPPPPSPEEVEKIKRQIHRLREEAREAEERGDEEAAEEKMRRAEELERKLRPPGRPHPGEKLSEDEIEEVLNWLEKHEPETLEKLERLREREPGAYYHFLRELREKMRDMDELRKRNPKEYKRLVELRKLDRKVWELIEEHKEADSDEDRAEIKGKLKDTLSKLFDLKQARHKAEIAELEKEIAKLKEIYKYNQEHKEQIINDRLKELTGKKRPFDW